MDYGKFIQRNNDNTKKVNCAGTCKLCNTKNINYGIVKESFTYFCIKCNVELSREQIAIS